MFKSSFKHHMRASIPAFVILAAMIVFASTVSDDFRKTSNIGNILVQVTPLAIAAIGQFIVILSGNLDFSVGSIISFSSVVVAYMSATDIPGGGIIGIVLAILLSVGFGVINGVGIVYFNVPPMIMSFGVMTIVKGISLIIMVGSGGSTPTQIAKFFTMTKGPFSIMALTMFLIYGIMIFITSMTPFGRKLYAVGNDKQHAKESGIKSGKIIIIAYALSGLFSSLAGILLCFRMFSGNPNVGDYYSMDTVTAAILGGTSLAGGYGSLLGTFAGAVILTLIKNILNMINISTTYQYIVKGAILTLALLFFQLRRKHGNENE